eukprot:Lankesteria_metandrocarpae@DN7172_c0_g1_i1.p1
MTSDGLASIALVAVLKLMRRTECSAWYPVSSPGSISDRNNPMMTNNRPSFDAGLDERKFLRAMKQLVPLALSQTLPSKQQFPETFLLSSSPAYVYCTSREVRLCDIVELCSWNPALPLCPTLKVATAGDTSDSEVSCGVSRAFERLERQLHGLASTTTMRFVVGSADVSDFLRWGADLTEVVGPGAQKTEHYPLSYFYLSLTEDL